jgi:hypothetical protein
VICDGCEGGVMMRWVRGGHDGCTLMHRSMNVCVLWRVHGFEGALEKVHGLYGHAYSMNMDSNVFSLLWV